MVDPKAYFQRISEFKLLAKKEVGQNFLLDINVAKSIVALSEATGEDKVLEIGCGAGSLTYFLAQEGFDATAIDIDPSMVGKLEQDFASVQNIKIVQANGMRFDYSPYTKIIGNLPYYITSGLMEKALLGGTNCSTFVFMVQKEAAERLLSKPNTKDYSPLSILISLSSEAKTALKVSRNCFCPAPHVDSSVIVLKRKENDVSKIEKTYRFALQCFKQRRKTLANNLKSMGKSQQEIARLLSLIGFDSSARPEQLSPEQYFVIANI